MTLTLTPPAPTPYAQSRSRHLRYYADGAAVLPSTEFFGRFNPRFPNGHVNHYGDTLCLAKRPTGAPTRVLTGGDYLDLVGDWIVLRHDQTGSKMGEYYIVGIAREDGSFEGNVPDKALPVAVFK